MQLFSKSKNKIYSVVVSILLVIQPLAAIDITSVNGLKLQGGGVHQPSQGVRSFVDNAKDTLPIVNINTPNGAGVSHNTYNHFNVDTGGLVLNNNATNVYTQLAGWIEGNPNLRTNSEAKLIINEVVSNNPSLLKGFIEVAGKKADVIVANPNGITLNGAGFINTNKVTLTTGIPYINANTGNIEKFIVKNGTVVVDGDSNILEQAQLDILSRALIVNKKLKANVLNIRTGANEIDAQTLNAKPITPESQAPSFSVDVSSLGGMYANVISLQGTEAGVGVNMQGELLSESNLNLDVNGNITLGGQTHAKNINSSSQSLNINGVILSDEKLELKTNEDFYQSSTGNIKSKDLSIKSNNGNITINGGISTDNILDIEAKKTLNINGDINSDNSLDITASLMNLLNSKVVAKKTLNLETTQGDITLDKSLIQSKEDSVSVKSKNKLSLKNESSISAFNTMDIQVDSLEVDKSSISSGKKLTIHNNNQPLSSFSNTNNSIVISEDDDVQIAANNITNTDSKVIAGKNIHFKTKDFINTHGLIFAINDVTIDDGMGGRANSIVNKEADIVAFDGNLTLRAKTVANEGKAPTFVSDGYVATWYETASGSSKDVIPNTYKLFKDGILGTDSKPKAQYYQAYVDLLTALMKGVTPNAQAKALIKDSLINPDGSINQDMLNIWTRLGGKATQNGISDFDAHLKTLLVSKVSVQVQAKENR